MDLLKQEYVGLNSLFCMIISYISIYHNVAFIYQSDMSHLN